MAHTPAARVKGGEVSGAERRPARCTLRSVRGDTERQEGLRHRKNAVRVLGVGGYAQGQWC
jgi:hypothetical protein